jgi:hypothetical protein
VTTADGNPDFDLSTGITGTGKRERTIMGKLDGKVAIVTGAARGLGRAYSRPARRWRCSAIPRWFGLTVIPNSRDK